MLDNKNIIRLIMWTATDHFHQNLTVGGDENNVRRYAQYRMPKHSTIICIVLINRRIGCVTNHISVDIIN